ncbi:MAG TPA: glycosyltransferase family 39 protein [Vicinamibacterales bacterium]|nr:glycosyltransferase family 39 protein [Vicinamibacterales bacterium]
MIERASILIAALAAVALCAFGLVRGTWAVGGSDSSCYGLMAKAFAEGRLQLDEPLAATAPWSNAALTFAPGGFIPAVRSMTAASPVCAPGFSLLLAPFHKLGGADAVFVVTPLFGAMLVWLAFVAGRRLASPVAGAVAAILVASTPVVLFQVVQPMNDIAVAALWMGVVVAATVSDPSRPWVIGAVTGLAVLIRPNLAPSAVVVAVWFVATTWRRDLTLRAAVRPAVALALAALPFAGILLFLNNALYGHPLSTGYGSAAELFGATNVSTNTRAYATALWKTQLAFPALAIAAPFVVARRYRAVAWVGLAIAATVIAVYLLYRSFPEWWYLRFLLPALVVTTVLAATVIARTPSAIALLIAVALSWFMVDTARDRHAFDLHRLERRFRETGLVVRDRLPDNAALITVWSSGTVRFHADQPALVWDWLDPRSLEPAIAWLSQRGFETYIVIERWEEPQFRERFAGHTGLGNLDWPPRFDIESQVRIFKVADRAPYMRGGNVPTESVVRRR